MSHEPSSPNAEARVHSYGQAAPPTFVDRFGVWLSGRQIRRFCPDFSGKRVADFGCGYNATLLRPHLASVRSAFLADVALAPDLKALVNVSALEGYLPAVAEAAPDNAFDVVLCTSVLEHLWDPLAALRQFRRVLAPGGIGLFNVPSWRGKWFLEFSAFRLGLSPAGEMDDHKMYYDARDLWPLLVQAGFAPHNIRCFSHKFGLNTFAACKVDR